MTFVALVALALAGQDGPQDPWRDLFERLARLERLSPKSRDFRELSESLSAVGKVREREGRKSLNFVEKSRARVLLFHLDRLRGLPAKPASEPGVTLAWLPHEAWFSTRALTPGVARVETAIAALLETPTPVPERLAWILRVCDEERLALRLDLAERCALALEHHEHTSDNALRVARLFVLRGNADGAYDALTGAIASANDEPTRLRLQVERARAHSNLQRERAALADWGAALAAESDDAALDLAARALVRGERARALVLADLVLTRTPDRDDARVTFGRALLPEPAVLAGAIPTEHLSAPGGKVP